MARAWRPPAEESRGRWDGSPRRPEPWARRSREGLAMASPSPQLEEPTCNLCKRRVCWDLNSSRRRAVGRAGGQRARLTEGHDKHAHAEGKALPHLWVSDWSTSSARESTQAVPLRVRSVQNLPGQSQKMAQNSQEPWAEAAHQVPAETRLDRALPR